MLDESLRRYLDALASGAPTPGGGSVAALTGAQAAALLAMVCNLTLDRPKFAAVQHEIQVVLEAVEALRRRLEGLVEADIAAFKALSAAYKLPRETEAQKAARTEAIQEALRTATDVPLQIAAAAAAVLDWCPVLIEKGNPAAVSDVGVAGLLAGAAVRSAELNVRINLTTLKDAEYRQTAAAEIERLRRTVRERVEPVFDAVVARL